MRTIQRQAQSNKIWNFAALAATVLSGAGAVSSAQAQIIKVDGSSTVFPITEAVAEEYGKKSPVRVTVGMSGTGGGFKKFTAGETVISNASRPIKATEAAKARANGIEYIELPVAIDALTVVVNPKNTWAKSLTLAELKKIWAPGSKINNWSQVRKGFPNRPLKLYGPGTDSGTFDYFTEAVNGKEDASRSDYTASEDDNVLVRGVSQDVNALGYFGYAYYAENTKRLRAVAINGVLPSAATVTSGKYRPLSRPLFIYVSKKAATQSYVANFVNFYLANAGKLARQVGYVALPASQAKAAQQRFAARKTGSIYGGQGAVVKR